MLEAYENDVKTLIEWYIKAKKTSIIAESLDTENSTYIQPLHEQRYCLDHLCRAIAYEKDINHTDVEIRKALSAAISHLQRSYSDSIEWIFVSVKDEYTTLLKPFTSDQIKTVFPQYYTEIRPDLDRINNQINEYKINKSVETADRFFALENNEEISRIANQFVTDDAVAKLNSYVNLLHEHYGTLVELREQDKKNNILDKIIIPAIVAIVTGIIVGCIVYFICNY